MAPTERLRIEFQVAGLPPPQVEYRFMPKPPKGEKRRQWRFDFAWPDLWMAVEYEGGIWSGGRHTRGKGFQGDCEKYNEATRLGWRVFRFTVGMVESGQMRVFLEKVWATTRLK